MLLQKSVGNNNYAYNNYVFNPSGTHKVILSGTTTQAVYFQSYNHSHFNNLEITKPLNSGYTFNYSPVWHYLIEGARMKNFFGMTGTYAPSGNYSTSSTDMSYKSPGFSIDVNRTYNSADTRTTGPLGKGWRFGYEGYIDNPGTVGDKIVHLPDGSTQTFIYNSQTYSYTADDSRNNLYFINSLFVLVTKDLYNYKFDANGFLTSIIDRNGNTITINVNSAGKVTSVVDQVGRQLTVVYNDQGLISTITDRIDRVTTYVYASGHLSTVTDPMGIITRYNYDTQGFLSEIRNTSNVLLESIVYDHNNRDRVIYMQDKYGNVKSYSYNDYAQQTTITDSNNRQTKILYDGSYGITSTIDPEGKTTTTIYSTDTTTKRNKYWEELSVTDRNSNLTTYIRDAEGNVTKVTNPDNSNKQYTYDSNNNLTREIEENGKNTFYVYDSSMFNLMELARPLNGTDDYTLVSHDDSKFAITKYTYYAPGENGYTAKGLLKELIKPEGGLTTYTYDQYGNMQTITDPDSKTTTLSSNAIGWISSSISPKQHITTYNYDHNGNLEKQVLNGVETIRITYDTEGRKSMEVSPNQYDQAKDSISQHTYNDNCGIILIVGKSVV